MMSTWHRRNRKMALEDVLLQTMRTEMVSSGIPISDHFSNWFKVGTKPVVKNGAVYGFATKLTVKQYNATQSAS